MKTNNLFLKVSLGLLLSGVAISQSFAAPAADSYSAGRVVVDSNKSFEQVSDSVKKLVASNGMMIMATVDQGKMLSMTGLKLKATLYLIGNPTVGKKLFQENHGVGLYVPLRLFVYSDEAGMTHLAYDKPSVLLAQFQNRKVAMVADMLDKKLEGLATMSAQ